ncbi:MAG: PA0069 family radical SAM protein [Steroidobacteraceae bacterium]
MSAIVKGRGSTLQPAVRFDALAKDYEPEAGLLASQGQGLARTVVSIDHARSIISHNQSPDIGFDQSVNPYRGCEHGCVYCYARPSHAYLGLSPGLDFETRIFAKPNAAALLARALSQPSYRVSTLMLGANTDPYQPAERKHMITRGCLEVLLERRHPVAIVTKSTLIERDLDLLAKLAALDLVAVSISLPLLDNDLKRVLEPRAAAPAARLACIRALRAASVPVTVLVAPVIPFINDQDLERILELAREAGASSAGYVMLRLPLEVAPLFRDWLATHYPERASRVMAAVQNMRGGRDNDSRFGKRMTGAGPYADLLRSRFRRACQRLGLAQRMAPQLDTSRFRAPPQAPGQASFGF